MDQNVILVETVPLEFDLESLGCRLRIRPGQTKFMDRLSRLAEEAVRVARPKAFPYLASEGTELADWSLSLSSSLEQVFASALREVAVQQAENLLERTLLERYGIAQVSAMNPGSLKVWSLEEQVPLFELLAPLPEKLGVTLLPSLMMRPEYSVSGVFFQTDSKFYNCQLCPKKECPNRRIPSLVT